jgi:hypothetical protein
VIQMKGAILMVLLFAAFAVALALLGNSVA